MAAADPRLSALREVPQPGVLLGLPLETNGLDVVDLDFAEAARQRLGARRREVSRADRDIVLITPPHHVVECGGAYVWRFRDAAIGRFPRFFANAGFMSPMI